MEDKDELTIQQLEEAINEMHKSKVVDVAYRINYDLVCKALALLKKQKEENEVLEEALELMRSHACLVVSNRRRCHLCDGCYLREEQKERFKAQAKARIDERNRRNERSSVNLVEKNVHGAWVVYGEIGIRQYYGYSKAEAVRRYKEECKNAVITEVKK